MRLAIEWVPFLQYSHKGPKVFLSRLADSIRRQKLCRVRSPLTPYYDIALFAYNDKSLFQKPYVIRVDGIFFDANNTVGNSDALNRTIFQGIENASGVVFVSEFSRNIVEKFYKKPSVPTTIIHNKVPIDLFTPVGENMRSRIGIPSNSRVLVTSAHWRRHKRLEETIKLISKLNARSKHDYRLLVLGAKPNHISTAEGVIFCGEIKPKDLPRWYRTGDIYVHLAWIEPCGNTQIEAMACGLPVICTNNGGIGETVYRANGGIVSISDSKYNYEILDYYSPPEPDYGSLISDIETIFARLKYFRENINRNILDIDFGAQDYVEFVSNIYRGLSEIGGKQ